MARLSNLNILNTSSVIGWRWLIRHRMNEGRYHVDAPRVMATCELTEKPISPPISYIEVLWNDLTYSIVVKKTSYLISLSLLPFPIFIFVQRVRIYIMATVISDGLRKAQEKIQNTASKNKKLVDLEADTNTVNAEQCITTDHGTRVSNTDNWLRAVDGKRTGPSLLEDQIAREKVWSLQVVID